MAEGQSQELSQNRCDQAHVHVLVTKYWASRDPSVDGSYLYATYSQAGGSICESGESVHDSHSLQPQSYLYATYSGGSSGGSRGGA